MVHVKIRHDTIFYWTLCMCYLYALVTSYPVNKNNKPNKNEIRLPNGTIIGKYSYFDAEGNPINVKYYADNTSYGVELNSIKIVENTPKMIVDDINEPQMKMMANPFNAIDVMKLNKKYPLEYLNKQDHQMDHDKGDKTNSDYETYYQKELKDGPKNCNRNKIKLYYDIEKKDAINNFGVSQYCEQF